MNIRYFHIQAQSFVWHSRMLFHLDVIVHRSPHVLGFVYCLGLCLLRAERRMVVALLVEAVSRLRRRELLLAGGGEAGGGGGVGGRTTNSDTATEPAFKMQLVM